MIYWKIGICYYKELKSNVSFVIPLIHFKSKDHSINLNIYVNDIQDIICYFLS